MNPIFTVSSVNDQKIQIFGLTQYDELYVPEDMDKHSIEGYYIQNLFRYSDTYTLNIIQYHSSKEDKVIGIICNKHETLFRDLCEYSIEIDGHYTIYHTILPTIEWLKEELKKENNFLDTVQCYVTDGCSIYYYNGSELIIQDPNAFIEINTCKTTISITSKDIFNTVHLYKCYINKCKLFLREASKTRCLDDLDANLIYIRDLIWITLSVIKYLTEFGDYKKALSILEIINKCNYICDVLIKNNKSNCNCK